MPHEGDSYARTWVVCVSGGGSTMNYQTRTKLVDFLLMVVGVGAAAVGGVLGREYNDIWIVVIGMMSGLSMVLLSICDVREYAKKK